MKLSKVIVPHSEECRSKGDWEWSGIIKGEFYGNHAANEGKRSTWHKWYKVGCNDPECPGIKAVHSSVLAKA